MRHDFDAEVGRIPADRSAADAFDPDRQLSDAADAKLVAAA